MEFGSQKQEVREFEVRPRKRKLPYKQIVAVFGVVIILLVAFFIWRNSTNNESETTEKNTSGAKNSTSAAKKNTNNCDLGQDYTNEKQGYRVCFDEAWQTKETKISGLTVGFSAQTIDNAFPGTIVTNISDKSVEIALDERINQSSKFDFNAFTVATVKGSRVNFTRLRDDPLSANYPAGIETYFSRFGRTYVVTLITSGEDLAENTIIYDEFLASWEFLSKVEDPPWSSSRNILVEFPWNGDKIESPVEIQGQAIAFEASVSVRIKDDDNHVLAETTVQTLSGAERSPFKEKVTFDKPSTKKGVVEIFVISAKDGSEQDKVTIPINF